MNPHAGPLEVGVEVSRPKQAWRWLSLIGLLAPWALAPARAADPEARVSVSPAEDKTVVLHNPDMGWVLYENYPVSPHPHGSSTMVDLPGQDFPEADHVAIMFSWQDIERTPGQYDFSLVDQAYDFWKKRGKGIHLRLSTEPLFLNPAGANPRGKGIPKYILERVPQDRQQRFYWVKGSFQRAATPPAQASLAYTLVDARDAWYLERMEKFLRAVARRYRGERAVGLVDLRGYGQYGEWHSGYQYATLEERRQALQGVIACYARCFPGNFLALSYSYDPAGPRELWEGPATRFDPAFTKNYQAYLEYSAFDYALKVANVTFRRDGAGGAVHSNERKLNEAAYRLACKGPLMSEFVSGYHSTRKGGQRYVEWVVNDALSLHPNYVNLLGWQHRDALDFCRERPDLVAHGLRTMGYRLLPARVEHPAKVQSGKPFRLDMEWINRGVGRAMRKFNLRVALMDAHGKLAAAADAGPLETDRWLNGPAYRVSREVTLAGGQDGRYELRIALIDPQSGKPVGLPLQGDSPQGFYRIGAVDYASHTERK